MKRILLFMALLGPFFAFSQFWIAKSAGMAVNGISIVDQNTIWGRTGKNLTLSTNGGETWTLLPVINLGANDATLSITGMSAISSTTAFVCGYSTSGAENGGVWKTTDTGATWVKQPSAAYGASSFPNFVHFFNANNGITGGDPIGGGSIFDFEIYVTSDGGQNWSLVSGAGLDNALAGEWGLNTWYEAATNTLWFGTSKGRVFKTANQGSTWSSFQSDMLSFDDANDYLSFSLANDNKAIVAALNDGVLTMKLTNDGGNTFNPITPSGNFGISDIEYIPNTNMIVSTLNLTGDYKSSYSLDNGTTWNLIDTGNQRVGLAFYDGNVGFAGAPLAAGGIYKYNPSFLGVDAVNDSDRFVFYPNPVKDRFTISSLNEGTVEAITIYNLLGQEVKSVPNSAISSPIDVSALQAGHYICQIETDQGSEQIKFIKQ